MTAHTYTPDAPPVDPAEAHAQLASLLRRYAKHEKALKIILDSEQRQIAEIMAFEKERADAERVQLAELERQMRPLAAALLPFDPQKRKTISTVAGEVCFRAGRESIEVEDREAFVSWAMLDFGCSVAYLRKPQPPAEQPDLPALHAGVRDGHIAVNNDGSLSLKGEDGERIPIPGVRLVKAEESFTVKPGGDHGTV